MQSHGELLLLSASIEESSDDTVKMWIKLDREIALEPIKKEHENSTRNVRNLQLA